jgi:hypothetical protein
MEITPGARLRSAVGVTEVVVIKAPQGAGDLTCAGVPMVARDDGAQPSGSADAAGDEATLIGKRYSEESSGIEVLCTQPGDGPLAFAGIVLTVNAPKPLPSSD